jgi:hypothetical protein
MIEMRERTNWGALLKGSAPLLVSALLALSGCSDAESRDVETRDLAAYAAAGNVIDSTFPMEEEIRRFRVGMPVVSELEGGAESKEVLVDNLLRAIERADSDAVSRLAITREEFAWLYFPHTMYAEPPYELAPGIVWMQIEQASFEGMRKLMDVHGGKTLYDTGLRCPDEGTPAGIGRSWDGCVVTGRLPNGDEVEERLFGSILEVGGRYKFVSFTNDL